MELKYSMLLVAGNGRNIGKTTLACKIIKKYSSKYNIISIKICPHQHEQHTNGLLEKTHDFSICEEKLINSKDSSRMLQAGATKSFYVQAKDEYLEVVFSRLQEYLDENALLVCESGGLRNVIKPDVFLFVKNGSGEKLYLEHFADKVLSFNDYEIFDIIEINNNKWGVKTVQMLDYHSALSKLLEEPFDIHKVDVLLEDALGHILCENVYSDIDMPPFDKSAMDGYACKKSDLPHKLVCVETVPAGSLPKQKIEERCCSRIMTGAVIPDGADCVFMFEDSIVDDDGLVTCTNPDTKRNICFSGEDVTKGELVLRKGTKLSAHHMPVLASAGCVTVEVSAIPSVAVAVTGSEVIEPGNLPVKGKIRNSNASQVLAQLKQLKLSADYWGIANDSADGIELLLLKMLDKHDVVILTGGVSKGDFDLVPDIIASNGYEIIIDDLAIQPGKPFKAYRKNNKFCFALSGNPVASFLQFRLIVEPFLISYMGGFYNFHKISLPLNFRYKRKKVIRTGFVPVKIASNGGLDKVEFNGSAHIHSLAHADAIMEVPIGTMEIFEGENVDVRLL